MTTRIRRLYDAVEPIRRIVSADSIAGETPYVGLENIEPGGGAITSVPAARAGLASTKAAFETGDVLFGRLRPYLAKVVVADFSGVASTEVIVLRARNEIADARYVRWFLLQESVVAACAMRCAGANLPRLSVDDLLDIEVPLPPLAEQRRIADILDRADALRRKREQSIRLLDDLLQATFLDMFGDPVTNPKGWPVVELGEVAEEFTYGLSDKASGKPLGVPILRMNNLTDRGGIDLSDLKYVELDSGTLARYSLRRGDILFNRTNSPDLVGKCALWSDKRIAVFAGYLVRLRFGSQSYVLPEFVAAALNMPSMKAQLRARAKPSINMSNFSASMLRSVRVPCPSRCLQEQYAELLERSVRLRASAVASAGILALQGASLSHRAFRGEL